nr:hypothetical protein [Tanacetum cinerariifolium]
MVETDAAYAMTCKELMKLMIEVYCPRNEIYKMENVSEEEDKIERFIWGLPDNIQGNENHSRDSHVHQQPFKRPNIARAYTSGSNEKKAYSINLPYCDKCKLHHAGPCTVKCRNCTKVSHMTRYCKTHASTANQRAPLANQKTTVTCYECGRQGHYRSECPKLKNQNRGDQAGKNEARGIAYALCDTRQFLDF